MERIYVTVKRGTRTSNRSATSVFFVILCLIAFILLSFTIRGGYNQAREDLIENVRKGKEVADINNNLKMEHAAITRSRFLEMQAKRLGLKKAKEEEVLVLR